MAVLASPTLLGGVFLVLAYHLLSSWIAERRFTAFARSHGCEPARKATDQRWPWGLDRMYNLLTARKRGKDPMDDYFAPPLYEHATLERSMLGGKQIETTEPANVQTMLATKFDDWIIGERRHRCFRVVQGDNIFTSDGPMWQHSRAMFRPQFSRDLINNLEATERATKVMWEAIGAADGNGWTEMVDLKPLLFRFVLENATEFLFGKSIESQRALMAAKTGKPESTEQQYEIGSVAGSNEFAKAFEICSYYMVLRIRLQQLYFLGMSKEFKAALATMKAVPDRIIDEALRAGRDKNDKKFDLLSSLMAQTHDIDELRSQTLGILFASRDTTSSLLMWTLLLLGQNPEVYEKLRSEILQKFEEPAGSILDFTQLKDCRYLQYVLFEANRLYQSVPLNSRVAVRDTVLPVGGGSDGTRPVAVRKGQQVQWNIYAMHRRRDMWGDDALDYKPERWVDPKRSRLLGGGWLYGPFSGGPRICLGQQYAMTEASYFLVRFVQRYDVIELDPLSAAAKGEHIKKTIGVTLAPIEVKLRLHEAQS